MRSKPNRPMHPTRLFLEALADRIAPAFGILGFEAGTLVIGNDGAAGNNTVEFRVSGGQVQVRLDNGAWQSTVAKATPNPELGVNDPALLRRLVIDAGNAAGPVNIELGGLTSWAPDFLVDDPTPELQALLSDGTMVFGSSYGDRIVAADGVRNVLHGTWGNDTVIGGTGNDLLIGWDGGDSLLGGAGADTLIGGAGVDTIRAGLGNDAIAIFGGDGRAELGEVIEGGSDEILADTDTLFLLGDTGDLVLSKDVIRLGSFPNLFRAPGSPPMGAPDSVRSSAGFTGIEQLDVFAEGSLHYDGADFGGLAVVFGGGGSFIRTGAGDDLVVTGDGADMISTGGGNDVVLSGGGADTVQGQRGNDTLIGGEGNDFLNGGEGNDSIVGGPDVVVAIFPAPEDNDTMVGEYGSDTVVGGYGNDVWAEAGFSDVTVTAGGARGSAGNDVLLGIQRVSLAGSAGDDILIVEDSMEGPRRTTLEGGDGNDLLQGAGGTDLLGGGVGDDTVVGSAGDDLLNGGEGNDSIDGASGYDVAIGGAGRDTMRDIERQDGVEAGLRSAEVDGDFTKKSPGCGCND